MVSVSGRRLNVFFMSYRSLSILNTKPDDSKTPNSDTVLDHTGQCYGTRFHTFVDRLKICSISSHFISVQETELRRNEIAFLVIINDTLSIGFNTVN